MMTDERMAPGCFGSALTFKADAVECTTCPFNALCAPKSAERLATLRTKLGIEVQPPREKQPKSKGVASPVDPTMTIPKKVKDLLERIDRAGIDVTKSLRTGQNPFVKTPAFMKIASHILLLRPRNVGVSRDELVYAFMAKLNWNRGTAVAHAAQATQAFVALDVVTDTNGRITLKV